MVNNNDAMDRRNWLKEVFPLVAAAIAPTVFGIITEMQDSLKQASDTDENKKKEPKAEVPNMSDQEVREILENPNRVEWRPVSKVDHCGCVDGRCPECVAGVAGGDAGLLVAGLTAAYDGKEVGKEQIAQIHEIVKNLPHVYMHTDDHALEAARKALGLEEMTGEKTLESLKEMMQTDKKDEVLQVMTQLEMQGCGHLKKMLEDPEKYETRKEIVEAVIMAIVEKSLSNGDATLMPLHGNHNEGAVVVVKSQKKLGPKDTTLLLRNHDGNGNSEFFSYNPEMAKIRMGRIAQIIQEVTTIEATSFIVAAQSLSHNQTMMTAGALAKGRPMIEVTYDGNSHEIVSVKTLIESISAAA